MKLSTFILHSDQKFVPNAYKTLDSASLNHCHSLRGEQINKPGPCNTFGASAY